MSLALGGSGKEVSTCVLVVKLIAFIFLSLANLALENMCFCDDIFIFNVFEGKSINLVGCSVFELLFQRVVEWVLSGLNIILIVITLILQTESLLHMLLY